MEPIHGVPSQGLSWKTDESDSTMTRVSHLEGDSFFSVIGFAHSDLLLRLLLHWARKIETNLGPTCSCCNESIRLDVTPIVWSTCQRHFHRSLSLKKPIANWYSRLCQLLFFKGCCCTSAYDDRQRFQRIATPMTTLPPIDSSRHPSHHVSTVSPPHKHKLLWHLPLCSQPLPAVPCMLSTNYFHPNIYTFHVLQQPIFSTHNSM